MFAQRRTLQNNTASQDRSRISAASSRQSARRSTKKRTAQEAGLIREDLDAPKKIFKFNQTKESVNLVPLDKPHVKSVAKVDPAKKVNFI